MSFLCELLIHGLSTTIFIHCKVKSFETSGSWSSQPKKLQARAAGSARVIRHIGRLRHPDSYLFFLIASSGLGNKLYGTVIRYVINIITITFLRALFYKLNKKLLTTKSEKEIEKCFSSHHYNVLF